MRQRTTFFLRDSSFDPSELKVKNEAISVQSLDAAKEQRITIGLSEIPSEIEAVLTHCHELHIRWTRSNPYTMATPLVARSSPGLHVFFTPRKDSSQSQFCPIFKKAFGVSVKCESPTETFTGIPILSERFSASSAFQYHQVLPSLKDFVTYLLNKSCRGADTECIRQVSLLDSVGYLDIDFDIISHALVINAFWDRAPIKSGWTEAIRKTEQSQQVEVGILNEETPLEPEELKLGGFLTVLGEDEKPSATLFAFPARHHPLPKDSTTTYTTSFKQPTGLHPTLQISFPSSSLSSPAESCALHTYLTLPSYLFIDKYQLSDPLFLSSQNLVALHSIAGETDLEAPDWAIQKWGSAALLELAVPKSGSRGEHTVSIPLHLRYLPPTNSTSGLTSVPVPWPVVFWACTAEEGTKMSVNPFDRVNLGYDSLFGPRTMFYHVQAHLHGVGKTELVEYIDVPVLQLGQARYVEFGTVLAVVLGSLWIGWRLFRVWSGGNLGLSAHRIVE